MCVRATYKRYFASSQIAHANASTRMMESPPYLRSFYKNLLRSHVNNRALRACSACLCQGRSRQCAAPIGKFSCCVFHRCVICFRVCKRSRHICHSVHFSSIQQSMCNRLEGLRALADTAVPPFTFLHGCLQPADVMCGWCLAAKHCSIACGHLLPAL